ncbi:MAG: Ni/Fe hydrogenase subunit alpha [Thermodesulfobacteriota bacterium]
MARQITINPITRLEGHGKIEIFLDDQGGVEDAYWQVVELRGFEKFCLGRPAEEMPRIVPNICGVCPSAHHMASVKALDDLYSAPPTRTARLIRELEYNAFYIEDHYIHFFFLAAPDFVMGPEAQPAHRNILGVIGKLGTEIGAKVIDIRKRNRDIIRLVFGKAPHPEGGLPGGVPRGITEEERETIIKTADDSVAFAMFALELFKDLVLKNEKYVDLIKSPSFSLATSYMSLVGPDNQMALYDGKVRVVDSDGKQTALFAPTDYVDHIGEWVEPWTYIKLTHLRNPGWHGFTEGPGSAIYRVGPLARLNVADRIATPLAEKERQEFFTVLGKKPVHATLANHWARLITALSAAEQNQRISREPDLTSKDIRNMKLSLKKVGVGCVEAPRGTLFHHYETDDQGLLTRVNLIVATQHNAAPICMSVKKAAQGFIKAKKPREGLLNVVEMAFRAYDPCLACATHHLPGGMPLTLVLRDRQGELVEVIRRPEEQ